METLTLYQILIYTLALLAGCVGLMAFGRDRNNPVPVRINSRSGFNSSR